MKALALLIGFFFLTAFNTSATVRYVNVNGVAPTPPFISWATAATDIQDAVDAAAAGDEIVVTNGVYAAGGRAVHGTMTNRVAVDKPLTLRSVNGPQLTVVQGFQLPGTTNGDGAIRCVYLTNGASISGFTLTHGATRILGNGRERSGGGVYAESPMAVISNCVITFNSADGAGGGAYSGTILSSILASNTAASGGGAFGNHSTPVALNHCKLVGNAATGEGGGAHLTYTGTLNNSLVIANSAGNGSGGVYGGVLNNCTVVANSPVGAFGYYNFRSGELCTLNNCIVYYNTENYFTGVGLAVGYYSVSNSCTFPGNFGGSGNITNEPFFVNIEAGDFRLQADSPCINAGNNAFAIGAFDLDGNPRVRGSFVDMGAYEFQSQPVLKIELAGTNVTLSWPLWASDFALQQTSALPPSSSDWSDVSSPPVIINGENTVTLPLTTEPRLFRLFMP